jgi:MSHA biogenesis protein MshP
MKKIQQGFSIVSAIFLLVVLAFLGTAMVTFSTSQHQSAAMDVQGARAYQAARSGIEWGIYQVLIPPAPACAGVAVLPAMAGTLADFTVTVGCVSTGAIAETGYAGGPVAGFVTVYRLTSTATQGALGTPSYIERRIEITITR